MYYKTCPQCGCNLDPGERCECQLAPVRYDRKAAPLESYPIHLGHGGQDSEATSRRRKSA